jgi:hypothetical protein
VPVAVICCVFPIAIEGVDGASVTVVSAGPMKKPLHPAITKTVKTHSDAGIMIDTAAPFLLDRHCFIEQYPS